MKKILWIIFLGLFVICGNAYAATSLCVYKEGKNIHFVKQSSRKNCDGYALLKKNNPKLYKRIKWRFGSKSSSIIMESLGVLIRKKITSILQLRKFYIL